MRGRRTVYRPGFCSTWEPQDLQGPPNLSIQEIRILIEQLASGEAAAHDRVVAEMFKHIPDEALNIIIHLFQRRILSLPGEVLSEGGIFFGIIALQT